MPSMADPNWSELKPVHIPAVRRGTSRRRCKHGGTHFFNLPVEERAMSHAISRAGRRANPRTG